jgi:hypothetical protein
LITASFQVAPLSMLTSTLEIPLDPAKAIPPTETLLFGVEEEALLALGKVELGGLNPLNLVLIAALPGITIDERVLYRATLLQPLRCQKPS